MSNVRALPWQCNCCGLCNSYFKAKCQACFNQNYVPCGNVCKCVVINPHNRNLLVHGYLRRNIYAVEIPQVLSEICLKFYNDVMEWKITDKDLTDLYQDVRERLIHGPKFQMRDITFQLIIMIKMFNKQYCVVFGFILNKELFPKDIKNITINYVLYLNEINYKYKDTKTLTLNDNKCVWYYPPIKMDAIKNKCFYELNFECFAEILKVNFINNINKNIKYFNYYLKTKTNYTYIWNLSVQELQMFKQCKFDNILYSNNFNNNSLCIALSPNGLSTVKESEGIVLIKIKLLRLPVGIKSFDANCCIELKSNESDAFVLKEVKHFEYDSMDDKLTDMKRVMFKDAKNIMVKVEIQIMQVYNVKNGVIDEDNWSDYGFVK
eukprot:199691_1